MIPTRSHNPPWISPPHKDPDSFHEMCCCFPKCMWLGNKGCGCICVHKCVWWWWWVAGWVGRWFGLWVYTPPHPPKKERSCLCSHSWIFCSVSWVTLSVCIVWFIDEVVVQMCIHVLYSVNYDAPIHPPSSVHFLSTFNPSQVGRQ